MNTLAIKMKRYYAMMNFKNMIKTSSFWLSMMVAVIIGYGARDMIHSDNDNFKTPVWDEFAKTKPYKDYAFNKVDYLQPQYINTILDEEMLAMVKADKDILVMKPEHGVNIGDGLKFAEDMQSWILISTKEKAHKFADIEDKK